MSLYTHTRAHTNQIRNRTEVQEGLPKAAITLLPVLKITQTASFSLPLDNAAAVESGKEIKLQNKSSQQQPQLRASSWSRRDRDGVLRRLRDLQRLVSPRPPESTCPNVGARLVVL